MGSGVMSIFVDEGTLGKARHCHDVPTNGDNELRACRQSNIADWNHVFTGSAFHTRIGRKSVLGLDDADKEVTEALDFEVSETVSLLIRDAPRRKGHG